MYATSGFSTNTFSSSSYQWTQLKTRKQNLTRLFQKMQSYQFEQISADPDKPLADGIRPLDTADMERYVSIYLESCICTVFGCDCTKEAIIAGN